MDKDRDAEQMVGELAAMAKMAAEADVSRRTFVKGAAGAAATFALLIAPGGYTKPSLMVGGTTRSASQAPLSIGNHDDDGNNNNNDNDDDDNNNNNDRSRGQNIIDYVDNKK